MRANLNPIIWNTRVQSAARFVVHHEETIMPDDKTKTAPQDRKRINVNEDHELAYWSKKFGVSREKLAEAVHEVGTSAQRVADTLGKRN